MENALSAGYRFRGFHEDAIDGEKTIYLRHDLDISVAFAVLVAEIEAELGISSTFLVLSNSPLYNLLENKTQEYINQISNLGHWLGLHIDIANDDCSINSYIEMIDKLFGALEKLLPLCKVVSFHRPEKELLGKELQPYISTYESRFISKIKYLSDSNRKWIEGCPCTRITKGEFGSMQLLIHPVWWVGGEDVGMLFHNLLKERNDAIEEYLKANIGIFRALK